MQLFPCAPFSLLNVGQLTTHLQVHQFTIPFVAVPYEIKKKIMLLCCFYCLTDSRLILSLNIFGDFYYQIRSAQVIRKMCRCHPSVMLLILIRLVSLLFCDVNVFVMLMYRINTSVMRDFTHIQSALGLFTVKYFADVIIGKAGSKT